MADIPIVVVAYNRIESLKRILGSLLQAEYPAQGAELIISIDRGDNADVLDYARAFSWPFGEKQVIYQEKNLGLKAHILKCGGLTQAHDGIILLEDDLYVSPDFYRYALECYDFVADKPEIAGVALYNHRLSQLTEKVFEPLEDGFDNWYFRYACSWGQMWTKAQWAAFSAWLAENGDYDFAASEKIPAHIKDWGKHSWLKYHIAFVIETNRLFLYPRVARCTCFSDAGVNFSKKESTFQVPLMLGGRREKLRLSVPGESRAVYDAWMENLWLRSFLGRESLCVDLYGAKETFEGQQYLLTSSRVENAELLECFGREMRPQEWNVLSSVPGDELRLYKLTENAKKIPAARRDRMADAAYHIRGISYPYKKTIFAMLIQESVAKLRKKMHLA